MLRLLALAGLVIGSLGSSAALAQNTTYFTVSYVEVGPILARVGAATLRAYRDAGRKDGGNVSLEVLQRIDRPNQFAVLGAWSDQKAVESHFASAHTSQMQEKIAAIAAAPTDTRRHTALSIALGKPGKDAILAVTHVDVIAQHKDSGVVALKQLAAASREHHGNLQFDVWQQTDRPNHFTIVESWTSRGAFDVHEMQKETRDFRTKLAPMSGALYDERLYKILK
jgi:quinol monooxygenase YgiN